MGKFFRFTATGFCVGEFAGAPGTYGTIVGVVLYLLFSSLPPLSYALFAITFVFLSIWIVRGALPHFETDDPSEIVIDEIAGLQWALFLIAPTALHMVLGFALFRLFDRDVLEYRGDAARGARVGDASAHEPGAQDTDLAK